MKAFIIGDLDSSTTTQCLDGLCKKLVGELNLEITIMDESGKLKFSLDALQQADVIIPLSYERTPEISFSIGYGLGTGKNMIAYWNGRKEKYRKYGFYNEIGDPVFNDNELVERIKSLKQPQLKTHALGEFSDKLKIYIAGDARTRPDQAKFFGREKAVNSLGHVGMNPSRIVDLIYSLEEFYAISPIYGMPEEKHVTMLERAKEGEGGKSVPGLYGNFDELAKDLENMHGAGAFSQDEIEYLKNCEPVKRCFRIVDISHATWTEIYKPENLGAWIETGYSVARGIPVIGHNGYDFASKKFSGGLYDELGKYNERFGIPKDKWIVETTSQLKDVLGMVVKFYQSKVV